MRWFRRYNKRMESDKKIQDKITWLNEKYPPAKWDSVEGFHSTSSVTIGLNSSIDPGRGIIFKLFINTETSEVKFFPYREFLHKVIMPKKK